jgi:hypothetical protein
MVEGYYKSKEIPMVISLFSFYYEVIVMFKLIDGKNPKHTHTHTHKKKPYEAKSFVKS